MQPWKCLEKQDVLTWGDGRFLSLQKHCIELPDGRVIDDWPWLVMPDYAIVIALDCDGRFFCFRQTKYAIEGTSLAPIGGYIEQGEDPLETARRELLEEAGCQSNDWTSLGAFAADGNRGAGTAHFFLARDVTSAQDSHAISDDLEEQELLLLSQSEIRQSLLAGDFKVLAWATAFSLACLMLDTKSSKR